MKNFSLIFFFIFFFSRFSSAVDFEKTLVILGKEKLTAEMADTDERRSQGLMRRISLKDSEAMIFVFSEPRQQGFWMKDTLIPLSIGFFSESGKLFQIEDMEPASPIETHPKTYLSIKPAKYALEVPKGWFKRKKIELGAQLKIPKLHLPDR